jgi:uncharacterized YccA/Bax inhibitor family protein
MRPSTNPVFREGIFSQTQKCADPARAMTIGGSSHRAALLICCTLFTAAWSWWQFFLTHNADSVLLYGIVGLIAGLPLSIVTILRKEWSPFTAPAYALSEGSFLGAASARLEAHFPGVVIQAIIFTFGTFFCLLMGYRLHLFAVGEMFRRVVFTATAGIVFVSCVNLLMILLGVRLGVFETRPLSIFVDVAIAIVAALNLLVDFDFVERASENGDVPKYMEWYAGFGITVTLIWLYTEILWLLSRAHERPRENM